jgi:hypothetical protein
MSFAFTGHKTAFTRSCVLPQKTPFFLFAVVCQVFFKKSDNFLKETLTSKRGRWG